MPTVKKNFDIKVDLHECEKCFHKGEITTWLPPSGIDPTSREYKCPICEYVWYSCTGRKFKVQGVHDNYTQPELL